MHHETRGREQVLIDTTGVWGSFLEGSVYHKFMERLRTEKIIVIPLVSILENIYPVYRTFSEGYLAPEKGLEKLQSLARFYRAIPIEERIRIYNLTLEDLILALRIANEDKDLFIDEKGSLKLFDVLIAAAWMRTRLPLYTVDKALRRFGERHGLESRKIGKEFLHTKSSHLVKHIKNAESLPNSKTSAKQAAKAFNSISHQQKHHSPKETRLSRMKSYPTKNGRTVIIREAVKKDSKVITDVVNSVASEECYVVPEKSREDWDKVVKQKRVLLIVAELDGKVVGMGHLAKGRWRKNKHVGFLGICVTKPYRRIGIGAAMMDYMIEWAKREKLEKISLSVFSTNRRAILLYEKFGFELEGVNKRQFKIKRKYVDEVFMGKFLS